MSQTVFSGRPTGRWSIGTTDRYLQLTLQKTSGDVIPAGAVITGAAINFSDVDIHSTGYGGSGRTMRLDGTAIRESIAMTPHADHVNWTLDGLVTAAGLYTGKTALTFWAGFDSANGMYDWFSLNGNCTISVTVTYSAKSTATLTQSRVTAGGKVTVRITRADTGFTHTVTYALGNRSETHTGVAETDEFTLPVAWCEELPNACTGTGSVRVETFSGGSSLGVTTLPLTVDVPDTVLPAAGTLSLNAQGLLAGTYYVQGVSSIAPALSGSAGALGSTVVNTRFSHSGVLPQSGSVTVTGTVTDSRGREASASVTLTVYAYAGPVIASPTVYRCDTAGRQDDGGTCVYVRAAVTGTAIPSEADDRNTLTLTVAYKTSTAASYGTERTVDSDEGIVLIGPFARDRSYDIRLTAREAAGGSTVYTTRVMTSGYLLYIRKDGRGAAFGKACEHEKALEIPGDWELYRGETKWMDRVYPVGSIYMTVGDTNPSDLFGIGTWERIEERFLFAAGGTHTPGSTGGEAQHTLTAGEMPSHKHTGYIYYNQTGYSQTAGNYTLIVERPATSPLIDTGAGTAAGINTRKIADTSAAGGGGAHNNMPPFLAVYVWKRTA